MWSILSLFAGKNAPREPRRYRPSVEQLEDRVVPAMTVNTSVSPEQLVKTIVGNGIISTSNASIESTAPVAAGTFTTTAQVATTVVSGGTKSFGFGNGVVLSSGSAKGLLGPNNQTEITTDSGRQGDADLDAIVGNTFDAAILEFDFVPKGPFFSLNFIFGSDEYNEYVGFAEDAILITLNGVNIGVVPGTSSLLSVSTVNNGVNAKYFIDNTSAIYNTQMDGFTKVMTASGKVNPGAVNHIKLVVADAFDGIVDSWLLIKAGSFSSSGLVYAPIRYTYNPFTRLFSGTVTVANYSPNPINFPLFLVFKLPSGVTLVNATGKDSSGKSYIKLTGGISANSSKQVVIQLKNPLNVDLKSFFLQNAIQLTSTIT
jgi:hypothetical protein